MLSLLTSCTNEISDISNDNVNQTENISIEGTPEQHKRIKALLMAAFGIDKFEVDFVGTFEATTNPPELTTKKVGVIIIQDSIENEVNKENSENNISFGIASAFYDSYDNILKESDQIVVQFTHGKNHIYEQSDLAYFTEVTHKVTKALIELESGEFPSDFESVFDNPQITLSQKEEFTGYISEFSSNNNFNNWRVQSCIENDDQNTSQNEKFYSLVIRLFDSDYFVGDIKLFISSDKNEPFKVVGINFTKNKN